MTELNQSESQWQQFLQQQGAHFDEKQPNNVLQFNATHDVTALPNQFITPLQHIDILKLTGEDAAKFLHGQLTNDVEHLSSDKAELAGYCTAKGRLLATFLMWKEQNNLFLASSADILAAIQKRLKMFVLRAKVTIDAMHSSTASLGLFGQALQAPLSHLFGTLPTHPYEKITTDLGTLICLPPVKGSPRYQWISSHEILQQHWASLSQIAAPVGNHFWAYTEILSGTPWITQATQEAFVPQMLNYEIIGGVNFKKGCYPGQEIVARTQYLGKIKRRMALFQADTADIVAGNELFSSEDPDQPCGKVVNAAAINQQTAYCLAEIKLTALDTGTIHVGSAQGALLHQEILPYRIDDQSTAQ